MKLGIVEFLGADILPDERVVCHLVVGTADSRHAVATQADMNLKRIAGYATHCKLSICLPMCFVCPLPRG